MTKTKETVLKAIKENKVRYVRLWFADILGQLKGMSVTPREMETIFNEGQGFDGSSVEGFVRIEESDLVAWPDPRTFRILPWSVNEEKVAFMMCDITGPDGNPFAFAGLWEIWSKGNQTDSVYKSCTIITTDASESVREIHHRMPVILRPEVYEAWLDPENQDHTVLEDILRNGFFTELSSYPVSKQVNSVLNNDPSNIEPHTQMQLEF